MAVSVTVLGSILTLGGVRAEEYNGENFNVRNETYKVIFLDNLGEENKDNSVVTLTAGNGYELARGHSGNAGEVYWYWLTNTSPTSISGKPSLTVDVNKNATFTAAGYSRSWTVGTHKLFYIDTAAAETAGMTSDQIDLIKDGKIFAEYVLDDKGEKLVSSTPTKKVSPSTPLPIS